MNQKSNENLIMFLTDNIIRRKNIKNGLQVLSKWFEFKAKQLWNELQTSVKALKLKPMCTFIILRITRLSTRKKATYFMFFDLYFFTIKISAVDGV